MATSRARLLPALSQRDGLRLSVWEGAFAAFQGTFTTGVILTGFVLLLGADAWAIGLLAAIPALCQVSQLVAAWILGRFGHRKRMCVWASSASRYMWLAIAGIPFLPLPASAKLALFFALLALSTVLGQMAGIAWSDWMADAVPERERGRYFGFRNAVGALAGMAALAVGTRFLDVFPGEKAVGFFLLLLVAVACGAVCQLLLTLQPEPEAQPRPARRGLAVFARPLAHAAFVRFLSVMVGWSFVLHLTAPFTYAYALQKLGLGYGTLGLHAIIITGLSVVAMPLWGRAIDRFGAQRVLRWCMVPMVIHPLYWLVLTPTAIAPLWIEAASAGVFWFGLMLATSALLMEAAPTGERAGYMGLYNTATGIATSLGALTGGALLAWMGDRTLALGPHLLGGMQVMLLVGTVLRLAGVAVLWGVPKVAQPTITIDVRPAEVPSPETQPA